MHLQQRSSRGHQGRTWVGAGLALAMFSATGCGRLEGHSALMNSFSSPEELGRAVIEALGQRDREALEGFLVTRDEHQHLLWDELPESDDLPFEYARSLNMHNTDKGLDRALRDHGGEEYEFVGLEFTEPDEVYEDFTVHLGARLRVRRASDGEEGYLPILDVVVEYDGRWKPMNYSE